MSEFIKIEIDSKKCTGIQKCGQCLKVCPVDIFKQKDDLPIIVENEEDECTLCELCLQACQPDAIVIHKLYEK